MKLSADFGSLEFPPEFVSRLVVLNAPMPPGGSFANRSFTISIDEVPEGSTAEQFKEAKFAAGKPPRTTVNKVTPTTVGKLKGLLLECTTMTPTGVPLPTTMLFVVQRKRGLVLTATGRGNDAEFKSIIASLKFE
jgi:hypothetical protein